MRGTDTHVTGPLIYDPAETLSAVGSTSAAAAQPPLALDEARHPWLRGLDERALANLAVALTQFLCRPSFGARTKREIEFEIFALLRARREDWQTLGEIADDLAISRSRARGLVLEHRARVVGQSGPGARNKILREQIARWPSQQIERDGEDRLKIVIDDPFIRDLLRNFAYGHGILLDQSFASEVQTFSWDSYARLLIAFYAEGTTMTREDFLSLSAELRAQVRATAARNIASGVELDAQLNQLNKLAEKARKSKDEQRRELALELLKTYGPTLAKLASKALVPSPG